MKKVNCTLMFVTDDSITEEGLFFKVLESALQGGVTIVQLREKSISTAVFYKKALKVLVLCKRYKVPLLINDRVDIALAIDADGVHIGQGDLPVQSARDILGANKVIGLSVSDKKQAVEAAMLPVDYIGVSPIFATKTKKDYLAPPVGLEGLHAIRSVYKGLIVCIGGIDKKNAQAVIKGGSDGIAVVSAISKTAKPKKETNELRKIICATIGTKR